MEKDVVEKVQEYLKELRSKLLVPIATPTDLYSIKTEHPIQIGSFKGRADVVLLKEDLPLIWGIQTNDLIVIVECKAVGKIGHGVEQLKSYLCATDTRFGIFAAYLNRDKWEFYENYGRNRFKPISRQAFEKQVRHQEDAEAAKEKEAKRQIEQAIADRSQRAWKELVEQYNAKEKELQADLDSEKANLQKQYNAKEKELQADLDRKKANLQKRKKELGAEYKAKEKELQADLDSEKANLRKQYNAKEKELQADLQKGIAEAQKSGFWRFLEGVIIGIIVMGIIVIIAIIASRG